MGPDEFAKLQSAVARILEPLGMVSAGDGLQPIPPEAPMPAAPEARGRRKLAADLVVEARAGCYRPAFCGTLPPMV